MAKTVRILSMDLSLNGSAFAILDAYEKCVRVVDVLHIDNTTIKSNKLPEKLGNIFINLDDFMEKYKVDYIVREKGFSRYNNITQTLFRVVGVVDFLLYCHNYLESIPEVPPSLVKKTITGNGKASKEEVAVGINKFIVKSQRHSLNFTEDDITDAIAVGITFALREGILRK